MTMKLEKYGVILSRLTEDKIEMVRNWRNDPKISQYMEYREYITKEMQQSWFAKINNANNYYFIAEYRGKEIGLINIKDINYENKVGEGGIFIYESDFLNTDVPFRISLATSDFGFETLHLNKIIVHILSDNKRAIKYNEYIGYVLADGQDSIMNQLYYLTTDNYYRSRHKITRLLKDA